MASVDGALSEMVGAGAGALRVLDPSMAPRRWEGAGSQRVARSRGLIEARVVESAEKNIKVTDRAMGERESARVFQRQELRGRRELRSGGDGRSVVSRKVGYGARHKSADGMSRVFRGR